MARSYKPQDAKKIISDYNLLIDRVSRIKERLVQGEMDARDVVTGLNNNDILGNIVKEEFETRPISEELNSQWLPVIRQVYFLLHNDQIKAMESSLYSDTTNIKQLVSSLDPGIRRGLQWLFTSRSEKEAAERAYSDLYEQARTGYFEQSVIEVENKLDELICVSNKAVADDYINNRIAYRNTVETISPKLFTKDSGFETIKKLQEWVVSFKKQIDNANDALVNQQDRVKTAVYRQTAGQLIPVLREIPVEEISREYKNLRIKNLKEAGFETIADVYSYKSNLSWIPGISWESSYIIKNAATSIAEEARKVVKLKLSADDRSKEASETVREIYTYKKNSDLIKELNNLYSPFESKVEEALHISYSFKNDANWAFSDISEKKVISTAYDYLKTFFFSKVSRDVSQLTSQIISSEYAYEEAWDDFQYDPISYSTVLEEIMPGILGNDDSIYGLPEDLAKEINEELIYPDGLNCSLRRYQEWGVKYILHQGRVLLGDEMGLGKTVQAIATMVSLRNVGGTHFVVVCPASVLPNWCKEISSKSKLQVYRIHGPKKKTIAKYWHKMGGVAVATYDSASSLLQIIDDFTLLVVDEAHYIKNPDTKRAKILKELGMHAERELFMTGTALENKVDEMINLIHLLNPRIADQLRGISFLSTAPQFRERIAPVYYRRKREDVLTELPDKIESEEWCSLSHIEETIYEKNVLDKNYAQVRQVSWNCVTNLKDSCKAQRMKELITQAQEDGRKVLVFTFFLDTISRIQTFLGRRCVQPITGSVSPQRRQQIIDEFDAAPAGTVLIAQIQSGGTGLNIQSASVVIFCEPQFKPSIENQAISRAYRMGQARKVLVYRLLCEDTVDERIMDILAEKQTLFDAFADKSVSAEQTPELDETTFGDIIKEEIERIKQKTG